MESNEKLSLAAIQNSANKLTPTVIGLSAVGTALAIIEVYSQVLHAS